MMNNIWKFKKRANDYSIFHFYGKTPYGDFLVDLEITLDRISSYSRVKKYDRVEIVKNSGYTGIRKYSESSVKSMKKLSSLPEEIMRRAGPLLIEAIFEYL